MDFELIKVKPGERLDEILPLRKEIFGYGEDELDEVGISMAMKTDGQVIAVGRILLDMEADRLIIEQIGVKEGYRRQKIATQMLDRLMDVARESRSEEVWAKSRNNEAAMALLEKHGFEIMNFYWMNVEMQNYK